MERLALWDKSYEELATVLRLDNRCKEQNLHINYSIVKCLSNKETVKEKYRMFTLLPTYFLTYLLTPWSRVLL